MGAWYWIGLAAGVGVGIGIALGLLLPERRKGPWVVLGVLVGAAAGVGFGRLLGGWADSAAGGAGGLLGTFSSAAVVAGARRGGGTRAGLAAFVLPAALVVAALGLVPGVGYLEAVAAPALALRARRRGGKRYAGLRILAKD